MAQWRRCTNAAALRFGRTYYLLTIVVALALWLCDQHFCVHLHSLLACHSPHGPSLSYGGADGLPLQPTKHYVYRFTTSFQIFFGAMPSRRSTRQKPQLRGPR